MNKDTNMGDATTRAGEKMTELRVQRGSAPDQSRYDVYRIPYEEGMSVLDGLVWVRAHLDSSLAFRYGLRKRQCLQDLHGPGGRPGSLHVHHPPDARRGQGLSHYPNGR